MIIRILAVIGILTIMGILQAAEWKALDFDYTKMPCGIVKCIKLAFYAYLIWVWLGTIM